ncbi:MAG: pyrroloquinoline-quinone synthase PqqC [Bradymonadaceae bacterium]|nr:pyrroloquinoline-quinone synthase PqqC [Lujinxingiaceae bacterium]
MNFPLTPREFEAHLRDFGAARYHGHHPFHRLMNGGDLSQAQLQAWVLNRFYYQAAIPRKDANILARSTDPLFRRAWLQRIIDHDGAGDDAGGLARWLLLADALDLRREDVIAHKGVLAATRFAVDAYVHFVREHSLLEAVASTLTELFAPTIIGERVDALLSHYACLPMEALSYFQNRMDQAPRDANFALDYVLEHARTAEQQRQVTEALAFKCDVLWAQLDALYQAYITPGHVPPGATQFGEKR